MTPVAKGGAVLGGGAVVAAGGYGTKLLFDVRRPVSLVGKEGYDSTKFGGKFAEHLLSKDDGDNEEIWKQRVEEMSHEKNDLSGHLSEVHKSVKAWKSATGTDKDSKFQVALQALKSGCDTKYKEATVDKPKDSPDKWKEVWKYCSIDGKEHWNNAKQ